jgi:uncharacterized protein (DUF305 family)
MKQAFLAVTMTASVLGITACDDRPSAKSATRDQEDHVHQGKADTPPAPPTSEMQRIMDDMMGDMHSAKPSGNPDRDFATMMISHHRGAVEMARAELESGTDNQIRKLAEEIIAAQEIEIADMQKILSRLPLGDAKANKAGYGALMGSMSGMMSHSATSTGNMDKDFVQAMIPHHEGAVEMAKVQIQYGRDQELTAMAHKMIDDQTSEIAQMNQWLKENR